MMLIEPVAPIAPIVVKGLNDRVRSDFEAFRNIWFNRLLISTAVVALGLLFELPEIIHDSVEAIRELRQGHKPTPQIRPWVKLFVSLGWLLIVVGVGGEFVADSFVSKADGIVQTFDETLIADARRQTGLASERAARAFERAAQTEREASQENDRAANAEKQAQQENARAAKALEAAETARKEAEGFQLQIAKANERATSAEQRANEAALALARIKTPRSLTNEPTLVAAILPFKGTEYTLNVFQDEEAIELTRAIDGILRQAGWVRKQPKGLRIGITAINVFSENNKDTVEVCLETGIQIHAPVKETVEVLRLTTQFSLLPKTVQAAGILRGALVSSVSPSDERNIRNNVLINNVPAEGPVLICVGKKP
jgi:hypothetical protein